MAKKDYLNLRGLTTYDSESKQYIKDQISDGIDNLRTTAYKTEAEWSKSNPVLKKGEWAYSSDKVGMYKLGNGTSKWSELGYNHVTWANVEGKPSTFSPTAHKHTKSDITDFPSTMKNPNALTIKTNGTSQAVYDGGVAKEVNITPSNIGLGNVNNTADKDKSVKYATTAGTANTASNVANAGVGSNNEARHVWFSNTNPETSRVYSDKFMYNPATDTLTVGNITGKAGSVDWANVNGKPSTYTPSAHTHTKSQITDFPTSMPASDVYAWAKAASKPSYSWNEITGKPSSFTPASHSHANITSSGQKKPVASGTEANSSDTEVALSGISMSEFYNTTNTPCTFANVINVRGSNNGAGELVLEWCETDSTTGRLYYRSHRDTKSGGWGAWKTVAYTSDIPSTIAWDKVTGKPSTYPATAHTHDDRYYTESEIDGKLAKYLPKSGGTMEGTAFITWPDTGNWSNSNTGVTFPVSRGGLQWNGQSDGIQLYAVETGNDNLELYLKFTDDNSNGLSIRNAKGNETARISASGVISASSFIGTLTGNITGHAYGVRDYNDSKKIIQIGYSGDGLTTENLSYIAGYTDNGTKIKDVSKEVLRSWIGLGSAAYTSSDSYATKSHTHDDRYYTETEINDKVTALNNSIATKVTEKTIDTAVNFNTFTTTGIYHIKFTGATNQPTSNHGTLIVEFSVGTPYQIWIPDNNMTAQYKRTYSYSTWSGWTTQKLTDTVYTHPSHTAYSSGLYKITTNSLGHVTSATAVTKGDITALGIPGSDTNTWRGIQNNLTSDSTSDSLAAAQGKALKGMVDAVDKKVDGITVGGRNLLIATNQGTSYWSNSHANGDYSRESITWIGVNAVKMGCSKRSTIWKMFVYKISVEQFNKLKPGGSYVLSYDTDGGSSANFVDLMNTNTSGPIVKTFTQTAIKTNYGYHYTIKIVLKDTLTWANQYVYLENNLYPGESVIIANLKLEEGNKATPWTPAPEDIEEAINTKVSTTVFNEVKQTVDANSATITKLSETITTKADGSSVTALSNTVNSIKQTADSNTAAISGLQTTVNKKADGSTVDTISKTLNTVKQTADSNSANISELSKTVSTKADGSTVETLTNRVSTAEQNLDGFKTTVSKTYVTSQTYNEKVGSLESGISAAQGTANTAKSKADSATTTANTAKSTADAATTTANTASKTASAAKSTAEGAVSTANTAKNTADSANKTASSAKSTADSAANTANTAKSTADGAVSTANSAKSTADAASNTINRGLNKWLIRQFASSDSNDTTIDKIVGKDIVGTYEYADSDLNIEQMGLILEHHYNGYAVTAVKFSETTSIETRFASDDGGTVYLNGAQVGHNAVYNLDGVSCTLSLKKGWNVLEVVWCEGDGGNGFKFTTTISKHAKCERMDCYASVDTVETAYTKATTKKVVSMSAEVTKTAEGLTSTANKVTTLTNDLAGVSTRLGTAESKISQNAESISAKVSTTEFNKFKTSNTTAINDAKSSAISAAASDATKKANDAKSSAISTAASDATKKANDAKSSAISTAASDATTKANNALNSAKTYSDGQIKTVNAAITQTNTEISAMKGQIALKVEQTDINKAIDGVEIGGRNLFPGTAPKAGNDLAGWISRCIYISTDIKYGNHNSIKIDYVNPSNPSQNAWIGYLYRTHNVSAGETYTVSGKAYIPKDANVNTVFQFQGKTLRKDGSLISYHDKIIARYDSNIIDKWVFFSITQTMEEDAVVFIPSFFLLSTGTFYLAELKLEKGNKATDWTPAPEDIDDSISSLSSRITTNTNSISSLKTTVSNKLDTSIFENYKSHTHKSVIDSGNSSSATTFAYSKAGLGYSDYSYLAGWNGYELRAVHKNQFATSGHNHDSVYSKLGHTHTKSQITDFPTLGTAASKNTRTLTSASHSSWANASTDQGYVPDMAFIAYWNGAFSSNGASNLAYCIRGAFGTIVTKNAGDYASAGHTHNYAGSSSVGGSANSAVKLDTTTAGSATQPVYFSGGKPVACTYTLGKSVPSNAVFTDTNTWRPLGTTADTACAGNDSRLSNARPASDVYSWAKASSKPSYSWSEIGSKPSTFTPSAHTHNYLPLSGGTVTGDLKVNASVSTNGLEIYHTSTPFIDFHYNNDTSIDYSSRIIENTKGVLNINGTCCTAGGSLWCTSFSTDGNVVAGGDGSFQGRVESVKYSTNEAQVHARNNLRDVYLCSTSNSRVGIYDTKHGWIIFNDGDAATTYIQECTIKNNNLTVPGSIDAKYESHFYLASAGYSDPLPGVICPLKVSGIAAATRFYVVGRSGTWLSSAQPGGAGFECVNDKNDSALIPGWRIRNQSGAWVGASYNMDKAFHLYYAKAERLSGNTNNGTDADFVFYASTGQFAAKSVTQTSDERRKSIISSSILDSYKNFFMKIKPFSFKWKDGQDDTSTHLGVGAQSVYQSALDCGFTDDDLGFVHKGTEYPGTSIPWSVSYSEFIPLNIAVTQDHETRIEKLERENEELKQQLKELKGLTA